MSSTSFIKTIKSIFKKLQSFAQEKLDDRIESQTFEDLKRYNQSSTQKTDLSKIIDGIPQDAIIKLRTMKASSRAIEQGRIDDMALFEELTIDTWGTTTDDPEFYWSDKINNEQKGNNDLSR